MHISGLYNVFDMKLKLAEANILKNIFNLFTIILTCSLDIGGIFANV